MKKQDFSLLILDADYIKNELNMFKDLKKQLNKDHMVSIKIEMTNGTKGTPVSINIKNYIDEILDICKKEVDDNIDNAESRLNECKNKIISMVNEI